MKKRKIWILILIMACWGSVFAEDSVWTENETLGSVYTPHFPWIWTDSGWCYSFGETASTWEACWFWSHNNSSWVWTAPYGGSWLYSDALGSGCYFVWSQYVAYSMGEPVSIPQEDSYWSGLEGDAYSIIGIEVVDDVLTIDVEYAGGCEEHSFALFVKPSLSESLPPISSFWILHDGNEDTCEALVRETLTYDLSEWVTRWKDSSTNISFEFNKGHEALYYQEILSLE